MPYDYYIDEALCKGCALCVVVCPKDVLEIATEVSPQGYFPAFQARPEDCIYCATCCRMCPDVAITITETAENTAD